MDDLGMTIGAMLYVFFYLMITASVFAFFYVCERFKNALLGFFLVTILICSDFLRYHFIAITLLFPYMPSWFYPGALIACLAGGVFGTIYFSHQKQRQKVDPDS